MAVVPPDLSLMPLIDRLKTRTGNNKFVSCELWVISKFYICIWGKQMERKVVPSGPRVISAKNILFSFSIFLASCAWSVLNFKHWKGKARRDLGCAFCLKCDRWTKKWSQRLLYSVYVCLFNTWKVNRMHHWWNQNFSKVEDALILNHIEN